jgi:Golgi phosphoprotein 3 (GPP34)
MDGRPKATDSAPAADPVLDAVLRQVAADPRRRWRYWIRRKTRQMVRDVRHQLVAGRRIELQPYRILGVLPAQRIVIRDPLLRDRIAGAIDAALSDAWPVGDRTAALVALAAAAQLRVVLPRGRRRAHRARIAELTARTGPVPVALGKMLRAATSGG